MVDLGHTAGETEPARRPRPARRTTLELELAAARRELGRAAEQIDALSRARDAAERGWARAEDQLGAERQRVVQQRSRIRELEQLTSTLTVALSGLKADIERAESSRAWQWGHGIATLAWRLRHRQTRTQGALAAALARIERVEAQTRALPAPSARAPGPDPAAPALSPLAEQRRATLPLAPGEDQAVDAYRAAVAQRLRGLIGPPPSRETWPRVSAIVVTRDGRLLLERLVRGLRRHTDYPELELVVVDNGSTDGTVDYLRSLSAPFPIRVVASGADLTFAEANGIGVEHASGEQLLFLNNDVEPFEPGWLRELVAALDTEGVDAVGATLLHAEPPGAPPDAPALVQHRAIALRLQDGQPRAFNVGDGESLWEGTFGIERRSPAVTAACMLIAKERYERCGGFDAAYRFGTEDVDLGLKLVRDGAQLAGVGRAVLVHRESSSQMAQDRDVRRANRLANRRVLLERWGPQLGRSYRLARLHRDTFWGDGAGPHAAITLTNLEQSAGWGDWYTGHELGDALTGLGWRITYVQRKGDDWYTLPADLDYVIALMDPFDLRRVPDHVTTIAWIRNWTDRWLEWPWFDRIDVLLTSSAGSAAVIEQAMGRPSIHFPLATNPARFAPARPDPELACDYLYTGNRWGEERAIETAVAPRAGERFHVYGRDWEKIKRLAPYARGTAPYDRLPSLYASTRLVLDDTQSPTLPYGALNARVLDALAAGALPVTDCVAGARELFDDEFPVWNSRQSLRERLDELLGDEPRRAALARRYREVVVREHTYAARARRLRTLLVDHEQRLTFAIKIGAPNAAAAANWGDLPFARALARELQRRGHRSVIQTLDEWESESGLCHDVSLHLKGLSRAHPKPGQFNVLWSISHPDELTAEECDGYDLIAVASGDHARALRALTSRPVIELHQATDPRVFAPDPRPELAHDLVYVANSRNVLRPMMRDLLPTERDLAVWGANWQDLIPDELVIAEHLANDEVRHVYSSAKIVLCDHWDDMRAAGYISNRIYDALACGAFVISDDVSGLSERFGDAVAVYRTPQELRELIAQFLPDAGERRRRADRGRQIVLESHTFAHVAGTLLEAIAAHRAAPSPAGARAPAPHAGVTA